MAHFLQICSPNNKNKDYVNIDYIMSINDESHYERESWQLHYNTKIVVQDGMARSFYDIRTSDKIIEEINKIKKTT